MIKPDDPPQCDGKDAFQSNVKQIRDVEIQLVLSLLLGISAILTFCALRPRWPALYAARKRRLNPDVALPELGDSFFGWMPRLWRISEEQVLASAGLDAFVFLAFFKMAIKLFSILAFFSITVLLPINGALTDKFGHPGGDDSKSFPHFDDGFSIAKGGKDSKVGGKYGYLWSYTVFTYFFTGLAIHYVNKETFRIIKYRQDYLGTQSTITDRTFRLTGIPRSLRSVERIKHLIEKLDIGIVDSVTVCRDWTEIDTLVEERDVILRKLEKSWAQYRKDQEQQRKETGTARSGGNRSGGDDQPRDEEAGESGQLLQENHDGAEIERPQVKLRHGPFGIRHRRIDAIDYYEEKLRRCDHKITEARKKTYTPTDMALVTMDTVASCQVVTQARIDPRPGSLLTKPTPAPSDLVWKNTYSPRGIRRLKSWTVTVFIIILTLVFIFPTAILAGIFSVCTIKNASPPIAKWLDSHQLINSFLQNGVTTAVVSLLNVAVPYLYDYLSNHQGMISRGDVELSVISKNFFFIFFNTFFVFVASRTGFDIWGQLRDSLKDTSKLPNAIAQGLSSRSYFYANFIILQGIGLMPFRILEFGSVALYPIYRLLATTPRDFNELENPPIFQYGFYLPTPLLVFNLCLIYSVLPDGYIVLVFGVIYFALGYNTFKYMVLYAMDQPQHATGGAWRIICQRILVGLVVFEVAMFGYIAFQKVTYQAVAVLPLLPFTVWYSFYFKERFEPLTKYIALRAIRADEDPEDAAVLDEEFEDEEAVRPSQTTLRRGSTIDEHKEKGLLFVNPSMVVKLQEPWIYDEPPPSLPNEETETDEDGPQLILPGLEQDNVWNSGQS